MRSFFASWTAFVAVSVVACAGAPDTSISPKDPSTVPAARMPDGVYLEPEETLPSARDSHRVAPLVALRTPIDVARVRELVAHLFDTLAQHNDMALAPLFTSDAVMVDTRRSNIPLVQWFNVRLRQHDFTKLSGVEAARPEDVNIYDRHAEGAHAMPTPGREKEHEGDVAVRIAMENPRPGGEPLFGDTMYLLVREEGGALRISAEEEDNLP